MPGMMSPTALMLTVPARLTGVCAAGEGDFEAGRGLAAGAGVGEFAFCTAGFDVRGFVAAVFGDL